MMTNVIESFAALSMKLRNQQKLVKKIESIIRWQDRDLVSDQQHLMRLRRLKDERLKLTLIREELFVIVAL